MPLTNLLLTIHVIGAIAIFGVTFAFPFIGVMGKREGAPVVWFLELADLLTTRWVIVGAATIMPASGALLIVHNHWNPWTKPGRWLLAALILYSVSFGFATTVQRATERRALAMAKGNQFGPEFGALMKRLQFGGQFLTVLLLAIGILMMTKPGSGYFHP